MQNSYKSQPFHLVPATTIHEILDRSHKSTIASISETYMLHESCQTTNPDSYFLRFENNPSSRIIALPAALHGDSAISGIKWIASYPSNLSLGLQRASAVLILNDAVTGFPIAVLEGGKISAARTAASAVLGAFWLNQKSRRIKSLAMIGGGYIARHIVEMFYKDGWEIGQVIVHDPDIESANSLTNFTHALIGCSAKSDSLECALNADVVTFATNVAEPYVDTPTRFNPGQIILNISLRDIAPKLILESQNIFDDVSHCLKANTSPHLAEQVVGHRKFVTGTLAQIMNGDVKINSTEPVIFSPFGMGILDVALGRDILNTAISEQTTVEVTNFFGDPSRW